MAFSFLPWKKNKTFFTKDEQEVITEAIQNAERQTSGEIRVFVESRCSYMDALDRAAELFFKLEMDETDQRNAVLIYIAVDDHQMAVFGDEGIHQKVGTTFWHNEIKHMISAFNKNDYALGLKQCIGDIGEALRTYFPYDHKTDKNELPDEILFGR